MEVITVNTPYLQYNNMFEATCRSGNIEYVNFLLNNRIINNKEYRFGFEEACKYGHYNIIQKLIEKRDKYNNFNEVCRIGLTWASCFGYNNIVKIILEQQNIRISDKDFEYCIKLAKNNNYIDIVNMLQHKYTLNILSKAAKY